MHIYHPPFEVRLEIRRLADGLLLFRNRHFFLLDLLTLAITPFMALLMRTDGLSGAARYLQPLLFYTLCAMAVRVGIFYAAGLYSRYWRFASLDELTLVAATVCAASALLFLVFLMLAPLLPASFPLLGSQLLPRSVPLIDGLLVLIFIGGNRLIVRLSERWYRPHPQGSVTRVAIFGAGKTGIISLREIETNPQLGLVVVGFIDDDLTKRGIIVNGKPVLGHLEELPRLVTEHSIDQVLIAMPSAPGKTVRRIVDLCKQVRVETQIVPALYDLLNGNLAVSQLRKVDIADLLRREPVKINSATIQTLLQGKSVLVTGGGGSIGGELCRQILLGRPARLIVLGHGENSVFEIHQQLEKLAGEVGASSTEIKTVIADIRFVERIAHIFQQERPQVVFHAAAHKHVHLMEQHPTEAIMNNVVGTRNVLRAAQAVQVERFVMISTDKAVNPTSVMGATKRVAELLVHQAAIQSGKAYVAVRFGNVLGSRGSVVLTFKKQLAAGGPLTVTDPEMVRYFMTIPEAVQLVLQAAVLGKGGEVFMLDMGQPVKIVDLARDLITLSGLQEGRDIDLVFTGLRPGEKLYEEMFAAGEAYAKTVHEKLLIAANAAHLIPLKFAEALDALIHAAQRNDAQAALRLLEGLLPGYRAYQPGDHATALLHRNTTVKGEHRLPEGMAHAEANDQDRALMPDVAPHALTLKTVRH